MHILITGANGYIGTRLLAAFSSTEHEVTAVVRNAERLSPHVRELYEADGNSRLTIVEADFLTQSNNITPLSAKVDVAYYLIHSMGGGDEFDKREALCANNFVQWIEPVHPKQIIYLSGLLPKSGPLSQHLASRQAVQKILCQGATPVTTLRASIIVGSGSASFEIIRDLVEKLPIMVTPKWASSLCQPIAVKNVISYLTEALSKPQTYGMSFDIGGPETMTYIEILKRYAASRNLKRLIVSVPVFTPRLSSYWLQLITATNYNLAKALVSSLHMETICQDNSIQQIIPIKLLSYEDAIERAFAKIAQNRVPSTWYGALSTGKLTHGQIRSIQVPEFGVFTDKQDAPLLTSKDSVINAIWALGGDTGWPAMGWAWKLRGIIDNIIAGTGLRRGRRSVTELKPGDALDFWRVIVADKKHGRLILYAEMKLPGEAWLTFEVKGDQLVQVATFRPHGLSGRLYWYSTYLFHLVLFPTMAKTLASGWTSRNKQPTHEA